MNTNKGWIGIDLDGTLAHYEGWISVEHIGEPVLPMLEFVKKLIADGHHVKIFTARIYRRVEGVCLPNADDRARASMEADEVERTIHDWCVKHDLPKLEITCTKDFGMVMLYDDRCTQVETNTGRFAAFFK